jgi:hypothetical protein
MEHWASLPALPSPQECGSMCCHHVGDVMIHVPMASGNPHSPWIRLGTFMAAIFIVLMGDHGGRVRRRSHRLSHAHTETRAGEVFSSENLGDEERQVESILSKVKNSALFHLAQPFSKRYTRYNVLIACYIKN